MLEDVVCTDVLEVAVRERPGEVEDVVDDVDAGEALPVQVDPAFALGLDVRPGAEVEAQVSQPLPAALPGRLRLWGPLTRAARARARGRALGATAQPLRLGWPSR